jgi:intein/homing endonuclease
MKIKKEQIAYFGGYFDGEGSISIAKVKSNKSKRFIYRLFVGIGSSNNLPLLEIYKFFGGGIQYRKPRGISKLHSWQFQITGIKALCFLKKIYPYCLIKKKPIEVAFKFRRIIRKNRMGGFKPLTKKELNKRQELKKLIETVNENNYTRPN